MNLRLSLTSVAASALVALAGCGTYEEAAYPEAPLPPQRTAIAAEQPAEQVEQQVEQAPVANQASQANQDGVVGGDNDDETLYRETDPSALTEFRTTLDPYGAWVEDDSYGTVWVPASHVVGPDFTPYVTAGHWNYDDGYVWVSDYDWGWAPFHYGRWVYITGRGWAWIPGRVYSGAWVVWRTGPSGFGYVGWGPAPPGWYWRGGYAYGWASPYHTPYYFCESRYVFHREVGTRVVRGPLAGDIGRRTEPYVPAQPRVDQGRVAANPRVGLGMGGAAGAQAGNLNGAVGLRRGAAGPEPQSLGLDSSKVPRLAPTEKSVSRAYDLGSPKSAVALGARPPSRAPRPLGALAGNPPASGVRQGPTRVAPTMPPLAHTQAQPTRLPPLRTESQPVPQPRVAPHTFTSESTHPTMVPRMSEARPSSPPLVDHHRSPVFEPRPSAPTFQPHETFRPSAPSPRPSAPSVSHSSPSVRPPSTTFQSSPSPRVSAPSRPIAPTTPSRSSSPGRIRR
jgi:hypothetical protein